MSFYQCDSLVQLAVCRCNIRLVSWYVQLFSQNEEKTRKTAKYRGSAEIAAYLKPCVLRQLRPKQYLLFSLVYHHFNIETQSLGVLAGVGAGIAYLIQNK
ncbi:Hypothetical_protein [Hexamita inflata]|uniref:Hypothetical_protein n=1 Tax=Hexamita inflata TaxID=28002 RepID=A0AA86UWH6_9EUKA|nr:Hypothetical protein HINF_LOCUS62325 [Hexamita inflata]